MTTSEEEKNSEIKEIPDKEGGNYNIPTAISNQEHFTENK